MNKAKAAVADLMSKSGHQDTTVHETVAPAVQKEVVKPHVHEEVQTAVDKEVHQDHYHHTVQPIKDQQVLPEQHTANVGAVQHREFDNRDHDSVKRHLAEEQAHFKDERRVDATTHSQSAAAAIGGEHVHNHIHETIQPVVQKETIQPQVIHTTVPVHEVHHNKATHHSTTGLPAMTMDEFKHKGGSLTGREERTDAFEGAPKNIGAGVGSGFGSDSHSHTTGHGSTHTAGHGSTHTTGHGSTHGVTGDHSRTDAHNTHGHDSVSSEHKKPGLMDKLNPKVDADGDGKAGFMK